MLEQMYQAVSGASAEEEPPKLPDDLTEEKMVTVVNAFFAASNTLLRDIVEELVAQARYLLPYRCLVETRDHLPVPTARLLMFAVVSSKRIDVVLGLHRCMQTSSCLFVTFQVCFMSIADRR